jgi:CheY-like chemotaxis protein
MLRRVLGDRVELEITGEDAGQVIVDPVELDNAVLNLAFNARDAMPEGGRLLVSIHAAEIDLDAAQGEPDLRPGSYVEMSLTDTGAGMAPEVLARAFEPFFTTKPQGKGTGLGLATVYGFVKQSGGHVSIYSEVGRGTTVNLYLPRIAAAEAGTLGGARGAATPRGAGELVLVVEDDPQVRALTCERLRRLGYRALEAGDAATAMAVLERAPEISLVFSDVVMGPGASGFELADMIEARWPGRPVLLTSGFDMGAERNGYARFSGRVLQKPYNQSALAQAVRDMLHGKPH